MSPVAAELRSRWTLDPEVVFLNHGSFGACPRAVLAVQDELRRRMERQPVRFFLRDLQAPLAAAREAAAAFVGADPRDLVFVRNASEGVNAILRSLEFSPGDELLITSHGYNACNNAARYVAHRTGAKVVTAALPFPISGPDEAIAAVLAAVTPRTRLALVDHVTSPTGLLLPIAGIVAALQERGVDCLVDGAHAPGMVPLDLDAIGAAYYTGNLHKWVCAPKGAAILHVRRDRQEPIHPAVISHGFNDPRAGSRLQAEFDWTGTADPSPWLCVPAALREMGEMLPGGWPEVQARNHALACAGRKLVAKAIGAALPAPEAMLGSLASLSLPPGPDGQVVTPLTSDPLQDALLSRHRIEVPVPWWPAPPQRLIRISAQLYNEVAHYEALARALRAELEGTFGHALIDMSQETLEWVPDAASERPRK
ncbi:aminotransferase class V-fold PLP-dependent enzyme [Nannocystis bainbridge]|uniref:Aminotransferase class V-fold PLP-dependent enzyme n=1 Tax=Nannocystis bainbridge TaxID=2995303 RepID=A0ABT5E167_9BACT|nr:aminotransferase class V-fold PLP-dependent enzyme [Nannocystis bainbridge]MDC0719609.1 aminotransferase class V-fold PLP-dependent enzyme [Nannocystis bainbridge]